jgi:site-specific DNA-methyltransferase (adenine-specific)
MNDLEQELKELEKQEQITQKRGNKGKIKIIDKDEKKSTIAKNVIIIEKENDTTQKKILINDLQINLYNDDCLKKIETLADNSIDCIITDPPYFIDKLDNKWSSNNINKDKKNSHIIHLPKGMKFDKEQVKNLYDFYLKVSLLLYKKIKPGGYFLSFSSPRLYHAIAMACDIAGFEVRDMINWVYTQSMPKGMNISHVIEKLDKSTDEKEKLKKEYENFKTPMIRSCFEPICVAMKPIKTTFIINELNFKTGLIDFSNKVGEKNDKTPANIITTEPINISYDSNFLVSKPNKKEKGNYNTHITVKPVAMIEHLIKIFSKEKSTILDPFMGSGSTGVCCKNLKRNFVGIELNKEYYDICIKRIET